MPCFVVCDVYLGVRSVCVVCVRLTAYVFVCLSVWLAVWLPQGKKHGKGTYVSAQVLRLHTLVA
jgi:hypothetical protein